jgi:ABC-type antimicrobial peptide transport system permease subunit
MIPGIYTSTTSLSANNTRNSIGFAIRTRGDASALLPAIRSAAREIDPEIPLVQLQTMETALDRSMLQQRVIATSIGTMSIVALSLALGGICAVLSYVVGRRRREIAIRMALGARAQGVLQLILSQGIVLTGFGLLIGIPAALAAAKGISSILLGVSPTDPSTYLIAVGTVVLTASAAALIPAAHAARTDAKAVLRE